MNALLSTECCDMTLFV